MSLGRGITSERAEFSFLSLLNSAQKSFARRKIITGMDKFSTRRINTGDSIIIILIFFLVVTNIRVADAGSLSWPQEIFQRECSVEKQPVVEFWTFSGLQYMFFSQRVTWDEGRMLCLHHNGRMAILDNAEKAVAVAKSISTSNIGMEDSWIGGRRIDFSWTWVDAGVGPETTSVIPIESNVENFPPWTREPIRPTKECLAIDRRGHDLPNFIDLDCRIQRPLICEKKAGDIQRIPIPSKWIQISRSIFTLYHGKLTWHEAATFCRSQGSRLAILKTTSVINILTNGMTKSRPDFENVWIGGYFSYGQWTWMSTGSILNPLTDETGYPPWRFGRPEKNEGCLLLDRHLEDSTKFIEANCDKKRDFVCEEYPEDENEDWLNEPAKFTHGNSTYIIYPLEKTWSESRSFCGERGSVLAHVGGIDTLGLIIDAMGDHPRGIHHVWLGGEYLPTIHEWRWIANNMKISEEKNEDGFPPWAPIETGLDHDISVVSCLNLDRTDHVKPHFYALECNSKQAFICKITCEVPPVVKRGNWSCYETEKGRECSLSCDDGLVAMGVRNLTCTFLGGWVTGLHSLEFPLCLEPKEYTSRMIRSLSHDVQKSAGYYFLIDHADSTMRSLSMQFAEKFAKAFPVSHNLKMGMLCYVTNPPVHVPFNQTDNCQVLSLINATGSKITDGVVERRNGDGFYRDITMFNGRRSLIMAIMDSQRAAAYVDAIDQFKSSGHHVTVIGFEEDWKMLLPLATVGFDRRSNLFLFDPPQLIRIIRELDKMEKKSSKCKTFIGNDDEILINGQDKFVTDNDTINQEDNNGTDQSKISSEEQSDSKKNDDGPPRIYTEQGSITEQDNVHLTTSEPEDHQEKEPKSPNDGNESTT